MAESLVSKRIIFKSGIQRNFVSDVKNKLNISWIDLARKLNINPRTLADWRREKFRMSYKSAVVMSKISGIRLPSYETVDLKEHLREIARKGGQALINKQGSVTLDESRRKQKWREWWNTRGKFNENIIRLQTAKEIKIPRPSSDLAEFVGIMLGDGTVAPYHIAITLHASIEKDYAYFVARLIKKLFGTNSNLYFRKNMDALDVVVHRKQLVDFCVKIGLVKGSKITHRVVIPKWIMENPKFLKACVRGLIDTDGCVYEHKYLSCEKRYQYKKISFSSASILLLQSTQKTLKKLGFNVRMTRNRKELIMDSQAEVVRYISEIGTHNPLRLKQMRKVAPNGKAADC